MKIAVTAMGETPESPVDQRFGRARYFVLYDSVTEEWSVQNNRQNLEAAQGAGIQAGRAVAEMGAKVVLTGHCGPKAFATLRAAGIEVYTGASGTVRDAVADHGAGKLQKSEAASVDSHFGSV